MLDPIIDYIRKAFLAARNFILGVVARIIGLKKVFLPPKRDAETGRRGRFWAVKYGFRMLVLFAVFIWFGPLVWNAEHISGFDLAYPKAFLRTTNTHSADVQIEVDGDIKTTRTNDRSMLVDAVAYLLDFCINKNEWMPSYPQYKFGFFGFPYEETPFLDNKAAFQHGILIALRRTAVELNDSLARARSTSQADPDLQQARGMMQYDDETWWINPFDDRLPFGPVQPSTYVFNKALGLYKRYNDRMEKGDALFDTRSDNLRTYLDHISKDLGSVVDQLSKRTTARKYDPKADKFVDSDGNNLGWFDFRADDLFWEARGQVYAYHGLLQATREDFKYVIETRGLKDVWDRLEEHIAEAAALEPLIVSNGSRDGFIMPDHLAAMSEAILRARVNLDEISDILGR
jgi:hypothetical protein